MLRCAVDFLEHRLAVAANPESPATGLLGDTPDRDYDRRWAQALLERVLATLADEFRAAGRRELFLALQPGLGGESPNLIETAEKLGMTHGAVKVAAHRLRRRYGELLRREIAQTLDRPEDVEDEIQNLFEALGD